ncbi:glycosyltransferase family 4 protein [Streptomyces lavendofoliae]|uniref:Glycosyl transferase n=1 Tax=Streptomyces lavendofoliae TaxID=67314 RepID=A0A918I3I0_9ACTN|nr:glycosyltransferase family 1 protein [Streptomyces lavendofoliae]GGU63381.1 glycosyl transferase [Streptomyces lavendofoliae]
MRIAFVTETWHPHTDGIVTRLSATIRELRRRGHEVLVVAPRGGPRSYHGAATAGIATFRTRLLYGGRPWGLPVPRVGRELHRFSPDVVHVVNPFCMGVAAVAAARLLKLPLVASYHTHMDKYARHYHYAALQPAIRSLVRLVHRQADINLVTSRAAAAELKERGIPRLHLWERGVDLDLFRPQTRSRPDSDDLTYLYVGRVAAEKGLDVLGALGERLRADGTGSVVIVGDGPVRAQLERRFAGLPVHFTGTLHGERLATAYAEADVFVFPSATDTLGLVLLEAMASGLPVVAADAPATREILGDNSASRLFPAQQAHRIPQLSREVLTSMAPDVLVKTARQAAEPWGWPATVDRLLQYYSHALWTATCRTGGRGPARDTQPLLDTAPGLYDCRTGGCPHEI